MVKKFKEWRDQLTWQQVKRIMCIVGIITAIGSFVWIISFLNNESSNWDESIGPIWIIWMILFFGPCSIVILVYALLDGIFKHSAFEHGELKKKISAQLKEIEFVEVYPKQGRSNQSVFFLYVYDEPGVEHFAMKQGDIVYVVSKKNQEKIEDYMIKNWRFFEYNFTFTKEEA